MKTTKNQIFALLGGKFSLSRKKDMPKWLKSKWFRYGFLIFFFIMFGQMLWNTYLVFSGANSLKQIITLLWLLLCHDDLHHSGICNNGIVQTPFLVYLLSYGHYDPVNM